MASLSAPVQIEGRGNGIKTNVINNVDIAKALERPPECACLPAHHTALTNACFDLPVCRADIVKWYGCELGALTKFTPADGSSIVNGVLLLPLLLLCACWPLGCQADAALP